MIKASSNHGRKLQYLRVANRKSVMPTNMMRTVEAVFVTAVVAVLTFAGRVGMGLGVGVVDGGMIHS